MTTSRLVVGISEDTVGCGCPSPGYRLEVVSTFSLVLGFSREQSSLPLGCRPKILRTSSLTFGERRWGRSLLELLELRLFELRELRPRIFAVRFCDRSPGLAVPVLWLEPIRDGT